MMYETVDNMYTGPGENDVSAAEIAAADKTENDTASTKSATSRTSIKGPVSFKFGRFRKDLIGVLNDDLDDTSVLTKKMPTKTAPTVDDETSSKRRRISASAMKKTLQDIEKKATFCCELDSNKRVKILDILGSTIFTPLSGIAPRGSYGLHVPAATATTLM